MTASPEPMLQPGTLPPASPGTPMVPVSVPPPSPSPDSGGQGGRPSGEDPVPWSRGGGFYDFCAFIFSSRRRTARLIMVILALDIAVIAAAVGVLELAPSLRAAANLGLASASVAGAAIVVSLFRSWLKYRTLNARQDSDRRAERPDS